MNSTKNNKKSSFFLYISPPSPFSWKRVFTFYLFFFFFLLFVLSYARHFSLVVPRVVRITQSSAVLYLQTGGVMVCWIVMAMRLLRRHDNQLKTLPFLTRPFPRLVNSSWKWNKYKFFFVNIWFWNGIFELIVQRCMNNETNEKGNFSQPPLPPKNTQTFDN